MIRPILALLLSLALVLSGAASAVARAEMASALHPVLCGELAPDTAPAFDPNGKPLPHRTACPHCLSASVQGTLPVAASLPQGLCLATGQVMATLSAAFAPWPVRPVLPEARAPPSLA